MNTEIDADLLQYIHFDRNSFKLYMNNNNEPVDSSQYNIKWSTKTDNTGFQEWDDKVILEVLYYLETRIIQLI